MAAPRPFRHTLGPPRNSSTMRRSGAADVEPCLLPAPVHPPLPPANGVQPGAGRVRIPQSRVGQVGRPHSDFKYERQMAVPRLYLNHIAELDRLMALEFGRAYDGQHRQNWREVGEHFGFLHDGPDGPIVGFGVNEFTTFDVDDPELADIWTAAEFEVPLLGLPRANAAEIIIAARPLLGDHSTVNRQFFSAAVDAQRADPQEALRLWLSCLEAGDSMAHFALGYTLYELERYHEAYRHLRYYAQIAPAAPWNWCWFGKAAAAVGELGEARFAYEHTIELSGDADETDAPELLCELGHRETEAPRGSAAGYFARVATEPREPRPRDHLLGERFEQALQFAALTHRTQVRKGSGIPYVGHLLGVCSLVIEDGGSEDEAIGALLHDAAEDRGGVRMLDEIRTRFGDARRRHRRRVQRYVRDAEAAVARTQADLHRPPRRPA